MEHLITNIVRRKVEQAQLALGWLEGDAAFLAHGADQTLGQHRRER